MNTIFSSNMFLAFITGAYLSAFFIFNNITMLNTRSVVLIAAVFVGIPVVSVGLLNLLFRRLISATAMKFLTTAGCVAFLLISLHEAIVLHPQVKPLFDPLGGTARPLAKVIFAVMVMAIALVVARLSRRDSRVLASMITVMFMVVILTNAGFIRYSFRDGEPFRRGGLVGDNNHLEQTPNIYLIIADSYGSFRHLADIGIDQNPFAGFLTQSGFTLYDDAFANYQPTTGSMAAMLNGEHHYFSISRKFGEVNQSARTSIGGRNAVVNYLRENGYQTHYLHENSYLLAPGCFVDSCFPASDFAGARRVLASALPGLARKGKKAWWNDQSKPVILAELDQRLASLRPESAPLFLYMHFFRPSHPPNRVKGDCEEPRELASYADRVQMTTQVLETAIARITSADPEAVIVLAGDHGPMISNHCDRNLDISTAEQYRDRAGALLAIRWPRGYKTSRETHPVTTINVFRNLLGAMAEDPGKALRMAAAEDVYARGTGRILLILEDGVMKLPPEPVAVNDAFLDEEAGLPWGNAHD